MNNVDLTQIQDVDMSNTPPPFCQHVLCCAKNKELLSIDIGGTEVGIILTLSEGEGDNVANLILNQIEESQMIERD